jgi:hypothetical protein
MILIALPMRSYLDSRSMRMGAMVAAIDTVLIVVAVRVRRRPGQPPPIPYTDVDQLPFSRNPDSDAPTFRTQGSRWKRRT